MSTDDIYAHISSFLVETLEIDSKKIKLDARFVEDLDMDSIDAIDLTLALRDLTGTEVEEKDIRGLRSISDVVSLVSEIFAQK